MSLRGWIVEDTTGKGSRGALPAEATEGQSVVGLFDTERSSGTIRTAEAFNGYSPRALTTEQMQSIRALRPEPFQRWFAAAPGGKLEFEYPRR